MDTNPIISQKPHTFLKDKSSALNQFVAAINFQREKISFLFDRQPWIITMGINDHNEIVVC